MTDEGAYNLLTAITERAYKDYLLGLRLMKTGYKRRTQGVLAIMDAYDTAKQFLEGTKIGEYLMDRAEKEINNVFAKNDKESI